LHGEGEREKNLKTGRLKGGSRVLQRAKREASARWQEGAIHKKAGVSLFLVFFPVLLIPKAKWMS
jgi:hypothetical protein